MFFPVLYHKPRSIFKYKFQEFHNKNINILAEMILGWMDILWECTETCRCNQFFDPPHFPYNSTVFLQIKHSPKQVGTFMIISCGGGAM